MEPVRHFDARSLAANDFDFQQLADLENCLVLAVRSPAGVSGPAHHVHDGDQLYYVLEGQMHLVLGEEEHVIRAGSAVFIAQGTPHHNWNAEQTPEVHLDLIIPPPARGAPLMRPATEADRGPGRSYVRRLDETDFTPSTVPGLELATLASPALGSARITLKATRLDPSATGPDWHVHEFDQLSYVLEGSLSVEVGGRRAVVGPGDLVVVPGGVPHRTSNPGPDVERHLAFLVPAPTEEPFDVAVRFEVNADG